MPWKSPLMVNSKNNFYGMRHDPGARPQTGVLLLSSAEVEAAARGPMVSFGRNWPLAASPGPGAVCKPRFKSTGTSGLP